MGRLGADSDAGAADLRLHELVSQHQPAAAAERPGQRLRAYRQRHQHDIRGSRARSRRRRALDRRRRHGRLRQAAAGFGEGDLSRWWRGRVAAVRSRHLEAGLALEARTAYRRAAYREVFHERGSLGSHRNLYLCDHALGVLPVDDGQAKAVAVGDCLGDRQAEPGSLDIGWRGAEEPVEYAWQRRRGNAATGIDDLHQGVSAFAFENDIDSPAARRISNGVVDQIGKQYTDVRSRHADTARFIVRQAEIDVFFHRNGDLIGHRRRDQVLEIDVGAATR